MDAAVRSGLEVCLAEPPALLRGARFGLLANQASLDRRFRGAPELLAERFSGQLAALFGPQHGLFSEQQDNMVETPHARHPRLGVPVHSLYGDTRRPTPEMLDGLDWLLVDLQDVGCRVYTYVWTLLLCLRACRDAGVGVLVLDRTNPLGGEVIEGPLLAASCHSFVGMAPMPMRHALTLGEAARWLNRDIGAELEVVPLRGWRRGMAFTETGLAWVPPSPNLPRLDGALVYPGQVLLEGTNLAEGRGTTTPFEVAGAPWLDGIALADALNARGLPGLWFRPYRFEPTFHKFAGLSCGGVFVHVLDAAAVRSYRATLELMVAAWHQAPDSFDWRPPPYEYEHEIMPIDLLTGSPATRDAFAAGDPDPARLSEVDSAAWWREVDGALLYPR